MQRRSSLSHLIDYNCRVLDQGLAVIAAHDARPDLDYSRHSGPHLRHVIEHYEAFVRQLPGRSVDYDSRARDRRAESDSAHARTLLQDLQDRLRELQDAGSAEPLAIHLRGGLGGEENFVSFSTLDRELLFLASHAAHHYALIQLHCRAAGLELGADFGKAPSTVHHEQRR